MRILKFTFLIILFFNTTVFSQSEEGLVKWLSIEEAQKLNKTQPTFNSSVFSIIHNFFTDENLIKFRKELLSKFRLFQRKYLSAIAKLRRIGPPTATNKESKEIKKELNKNKKVDYKAYEIFCKYVLLGLPPTFIVAATSSESTSIIIAISSGVGYLSNSCSNWE